MATIIVIEESDIVGESRATLNTNYATLNSEKLEAGDVQDGALVYAKPASGSGTTYTATLTPALTAYTEGMVVHLNPDIDNTGAVTLNINGLGARDVKLSDGTAMSGAELQAGQLCVLWYNGTEFRVVDPVESGGGGGTINGTLGATDNALTRADGTGGSTAQGSLATVDDAGTMNIPTGQQYRVNGAQHVHSASDITTDTLAIARGGTGQGTANAALNALLPSQATHAGKVLQTDGTDTSWQTASGGSSSFDGLSDTPANKTGAALQFVRVNAGETALEYATPAGSGDVVGPASSVADRVALFDGTTGKLIKDGGKGLPTGDVIGNSDTQTLTNKTLDADANTVSNIGSAEVKAELITGLTADATPDGATDYVMTYDASATALKKVLLDNLPGSGGGSSTFVGLTDTPANYTSAAGKVPVVNSTPDGLIWLPARTVVDTFANRPAVAAVAPGTRFYATDVRGKHWESDGTDWVACFRGELITEPPSGGWTAVSGSAQDATAYVGGILSGGGEGSAGGNVAAQVRAIPTPPFTVEIGLQLRIKHGATVNYQQVGLVLSDGAATSNKVIFFGLQLFDPTAAAPWPRLSVGKWNSFTSYNSESYGGADLAIAPYMLQLEDDNTNIYFRIFDGYGWQLIHSEARTTFLTPSHIGVAHRPGTASTRRIDWALYHWKES